MGGPPGLKLGGNLTLLNVKQQGRFELGTVKNQSCSHEYITNRLNSGHSCYHSVQKHLSARTLSKNVKSKQYKTIILHVFASVCSFVFHKLRIFAN
jgi:Ca2+-dependent lipid-binding protein